LLIRFRHVAAWRTYWRSGWGSVIAIVGKVVILGYFLMIAAGWAMGVAFALLRPSDDPIRKLLRSLVVDYGRLAPIPLLLLLVLVGVFAVFERPFRFHPAEVELLQAGPFRRRQVLAYKMGADFSGLFLLALLGAPLGAAVSPFLSSFVGLLLVLALVYLFQLVVSSLGTALGLRGTRGMLRGLVPLGLFFAACALVWFSFGRLRHDPAALYRQAVGSPLWRLVLAPLRPFFEVMMAPRAWPDLVQWALPCLAIDGALLAAVYALDAHLERREDEADQGTIAADSVLPVATPERWSLPLSSFGGGAATLAWRQVLNVVRGPGQLGFALFMHGMLLWAFYMLITHKNSHGILFLPTLDGHLELNPAGAPVLGMLALILPMVIASGLSFDFRGDVGRMDVLKALPMAPLSVVAGQLFVPVVIASVMQWVLMAVIAAALRRVPSGLWAAAAFAPPVSVVLMAIENLPSFWFPLRQTPGAKPEPFELFGHVLLHPLVRMVGYAAAVTTMTLVAVLAFFVFAQSLVAAVVAAWLTLAAGGAALVALLARTFDRFDVTQDVTA
jgi:hypothetical protein